MCVIVHSLCKVSCFTSHVERYCIALFVKLCNRGVNGFHVQAFSRFILKAVDFSDISGVFYLEGSPARQTYLASPPVL